MKKINTYMLLMSCFVLALYAPPEAAAQTLLARGHVFDDQNRNGVRDANEPGIPRVAVSNGEAVVLTDADGYYELPISADSIVFVIKPRDWMTPVNAEQLPQFHYIHKPAGSPELTY